MYKTGLALWLSCSSGAMAADQLPFSSEQDFLLEADAYNALPDGVRQAVQCAAENASLVANFTLTFDRTGAPSIVGRYNVASDTWSTVPGRPQNLEDLDDEVVKAWADVQEEFGRKGALIPDDIAIRVTQPVLIEETDETRVYSFVPGAKEGDRTLSRAAIEALERRFVVDRASGCMTGLFLQSTRSFRPALLANIDYFDFIWTFAPLAGSPIPLIASFTSTAKGRALFKSFDEDTNVTISDVQLLVSS